MDPHLLGTPHPESYQKWILFRTSWTEVWNTSKISAWPTAVPYTHWWSRHDPNFPLQLCRHKNWQPHLINWRPCGLRADLDSVYHWTSRMKMELNADKFESFHYGHNDELQSQTYHISNNGPIIQEKDHVRDLGVIMSNDGPFRKHIQSGILEANKQCTWIIRTFHTREVLLMLSLWNPWCSAHWTLAVSCGVPQTWEISKY